MKRKYTRVAVAQFDYRPAALIDRRSPLEDPLFSLNTPHSLLPINGSIPPKFSKHFDDLRRQIRESTVDQIGKRITTLVKQCSEWNVEILVLPEYSLPWEFLYDVAMLDPNMIIVGGTHAVERAARKSGIYQKLGLKAPATGTAVCPVLYGGQLLALQPKLNPSKVEKKLKPGKIWEPIPLPEPLTGKMGVLICLDFLYRDSEITQKLVTPKLPECRFLVVPSLTPFHSIKEFDAKAWEESRRYGRPVFYSDGASGGGTSLFVDEDHRTTLNRFPDKVGRFDPVFGRELHEGVIVADVDLGYMYTGKSTRYGEPEPVKPFAAASFVYRALPVDQEYAAWLDEVTPLLSSDDEDTLDDLLDNIEDNKNLLLNSGAANHVRNQRLNRLFTELDGITEVEEVRQFLSEVVLGTDILPMQMVNKALAFGAAEELYDWFSKDRSATPFRPAEENLRKKSKNIVEPESGTRTPEGRETIDALIRSVGRKKEPKPVQITPIIRTKLPKGFSVANLKRVEHENFTFGFMAYFFSVKTSMRTKELEELDRKNDGLFPEDRKLMKDPIIFQISEYDREIENIRELALAEGASDSCILIIEDNLTKQTFIAAVVTYENIDKSIKKQFVATTDKNDSLKQISKAVTNALINSCLPELSQKLELFNQQDVLNRTKKLAERFHQAEVTAKNLLDEKLKDVDQKFVPLHLSGTDHKRQDGLETLDKWVEGDKKTCLLLGEFGRGKSTLLSQWAVQRWEQHDSPPLPLLVNLASSAVTESASEMLLHSAGLEFTPQNQAALKLLLQSGHLLACFDGFDEMATRLSHGDLPQRLVELLSSVQSGGKIIISSRDHYFQTKDLLNKSIVEALNKTLGETTSFERFDVQPMNEKQIKEMVTNVCGEKADQVLKQIDKIYPLGELANRPLLLGMILKTIDRLDPDSPIAKADVYEAYLERWLEQTKAGDQELFNDEQKIHFAEQMAAKLWKSGKTSFHRKAN